MQRAYMGQQTDPAVTAAINTLLTTLPADQQQIAANLESQRVLLENTLQHTNSQITSLQGVASSVGTIRQQSDAIHQQLQNAVDALANRTETLETSLEETSTQVASVYSTQVEQDETVDTLQTDIAQAITTAETAQQIAQAAAEQAATANTTANTAVATATTATTEATNAKNTAASALNNAISADTKATNAQTAATSASSTATTAQAEASTANATAQQAKNSATSATTTANTASNTATNAQTTADTATTTAQQAQTTAASATTAATTAQTTANNANTKADNQALLISALTARVAALETRRIYLEYGQVAISGSLAAGATKDYAIPLSAEMPNTNYTARLMDMTDALIGKITVTTKNQGVTGFTATIRASALVTLSGSLTFSAILTA